MDLSIIIVNWNTRELLAQCLKSLETYPPECNYEIWVVDNASGDGSAQMVQEQFPAVNLIQSEQNRGFGQANNLALQECRGEYIFLLNPDTEIRPRAADLLRAFLQAHPRAGAAGSTLLYGDRSLQISCYPFPTLSREFWRLLHLDRIYSYGVYAQDRWDRHQPRQVEVIQGAALMLRQSVLAEVGFFDPAFFMYTEEVDLCYRIHKAGWGLFWVPQAEVVHYEGQSTRQIAPQMFLQLYQSKLLFIRKHYGRAAGWAYKLILGFTALPRLLHAPGANPATLDRSRNYRQLLRALPGM